jgi:hypothetical protein
LVEATGCRIVHWEGAFICHRCARDFLDLNPWDLWAKVVIIGSLGFVGTFLLLALRRLILPIVVLVTTLGSLSRTFKKLSYAHRKQYLYDSWAVRQITKMAIGLCRDEVLKRLGLSESNTVLVSKEEHLANLKLGAR